MKYFTPQLWEALSSSAPEERQTVLEQWDEAWANYRAYMEQFVRPNVSKRVWNTMVRCHDLHDYTIEQIHIESFLYRKKPALKVRVVLSSQVLLVLSDVTKVSYDIQNRTALPTGSFSWGYCEFQLLPQDRIQLSVLCDVRNYLTFEFKRFSIKKLYKLD